MTNPDEQTAEPPEPAMVPFYVATFGRISEYIGYPLPTGGFIGRLAARNDAELSYWRKSEWVQANPHEAYRAACVQINDMAVKLAEFAERHTSGKEQGDGG